MLRHEKACKKSPSVKIMCFGCIFRDTLKEEFDYDERINDYIGKRNHISFTFHYCRKQKIKMIPQKAYNNEFLNEALKDKYDQIMPTISNGCLEYISRNSVNILFDNGMEKVKLHDYVGAIEVYSKIIEFDGNVKYPDPYFKRGLAKIGLKDYTSAIEDFNKIIENDNFNMQAYDYCIEAYELLNDYENARKMEERKKEAERQINDVDLPF